MVLSIEIRKGTTKDAVVIANLIKEMVLEMEQYGGYAVNTSPAVWSSMQQLVRKNIVRKESRYLLAYHDSPAPIIVGVAAAHLDPLEKIFVEKTRLHLSAVYTVPDARRQGVAWNLIQRILEWGTQMNAVEADLNVLAANPAWQLYEKLGFGLHEVSLVKKLEQQSYSDRK